MGVTYASAVSFLSFTAGFLAFSLASMIFTARLPRSAATGSPPGERCHCVAKMRFFAPLTREESVVGK